MPFYAKAAIHQFHVPVILRLPFEVFMITDAPHPFMVPSRVWEELTVVSTTRLMTAILPFTVESARVAFDSLLMYRSWFPFTELRLYVPDFRISEIVRWRFPLTVFSLQLERFTAVMSIFSFTVVGYTLALLGPAGPSFPFVGGKVRFNSFIEP